MLPEAASTSVPLASIVVMAPASSSAQVRTPQIPQITLKPRTKPPAFIVTSCGGECIDYNGSGDLFGAGESSTRGGPFNTLKGAKIGEDTLQSCPLGKCNAAATKAHRTTAEYVETFRSEFDDVSARYSYLGASIQAGSVRASLQSAAKSHCP